MPRAGNTRLRIEPCASRRLALFLILSHCAGIIAALSLPVSLPVGLALSLLVVASLAHSVRTHVLRQGSSALTALELDRVGGWSLYTTQGVIENASLHTSSFVRPWLMVLNFPVGRFGIRTMILTPDAVDSDALRRLRVRLTITPPSKRQPASV